MKRYVAAICACSALYGIGCGSSGEGAAPEVSLGTGRGAYFNPTQPDGNDTQPEYNEDQPAGNPDDPTFSGGQPTESAIGSGFDCAGLCNLIPQCDQEVASRIECIQSCDATALALIDSLCDGVFARAFECVRINGYVCVEGEARVYGCEHISNDLEDCFDELDTVTPRPDPPNQGEDVIIGTCDGGQVPLRLVDFCDGFPDCEDGFDEIDCPATR